MYNASLSERQVLLQKKDVKVLSSFDLSDISSNRRLQETTELLETFDEVRYKWDDIHLVVATDGEWEQAINQGKGEIGFGCRILGMEPFFVESPDAGFGLEPTFDTYCAFTRLFGCTDRLESNPDNVGRKKLTIHQFIFFSPTDIRIAYRRNPEYYSWLMGCIDQQRRCIMTTNYQRPGFTGIVMSDESGVEYDIYFKVYDICALVGIATLQEAARVAGVKVFDVASKKLMNKYKSKMKTPYTQHHKDFVEYALNDLFLFEIVAGIGTLWEKVTGDMDIRPIKLHLTMGANVVALQENIIASKLGLNSNEDVEKLGLFDPDEEVKRTVEGKVRMEAKSIKTVTNLLTFFNREASAKWLATRNDNNKYLLAAVDGGRCKNELPRRTRIVDVEYKRKHTKVVVCDTDIDGCYGNGLMNQLYPVGRPTIQSYKKSERDRPTLGEFWTGKKGKGLYKGLVDDLVPGLWHSRWSSNATLSFDIDLLISKLGLKPLSEDDVMSRDSEAEFNADDMRGNGNSAEVGGEFVLLRRDLVCVTLSHDLLQNLRKVCTDREWKELSEKLVLDALIYYPKSQQVSTPQELFAAYQNEQGEKTELVKTGNDISSKTSDKRCKKWLALDMGTDWVDKLACLRKQYKKGSPENTFYKLIINCIYGVACSVFFPTFSNVVVANNITARARTLAWMMAKTNRGQQSITDGSVSDLNSHLYWRGNRPGMHTLANLDNLEALPPRTRARLQIAPLNLTITDDWAVGSEWEVIGYQLEQATGDEGELVFDDDGKPVMDCYTQLKTGDEVLEPCKANNWGRLDAAQWAHMKRFFGSGIDILDKTGKKAKGMRPDGTPNIEDREGQFAFEIKDIYTKAAFQSQSNYLLVRADGKEVLKARGQNPKKEQYLSIDGSTKRETPPVKDVLHQILNNEPIQPQPKVYTSTVLKVRAWKTAVASKNKAGNVVLANNLFPGDTTHKSSHVRPISYSMFRYLTEAQYLSWKKQQMKLRDQYGWGLEGLYLNDDGTLDYDHAVNEIQTAIDQGKRFPRVSGDFPTHPYKVGDLEFDTEDSELLTDVDW